MKVLEYGVPFITNLDGKLSKLIFSYQNGIYIDPTNEKDLSIYDSIIKDKNLRKQFSINAKKVILSYIIFITFMIN